MITDYTVDYFIKKFTNTRDSKWCVSHFHRDGKSCANGWCGATNELKDAKTDTWTIFSTEESQGLHIVFLPLKSKQIRDDWFGTSNTAAHINNGDDIRYQQSSPKKRILAALYDIKKMQEPQPIYQDITNQLAVLPISETSDVKTMQLIGGDVLK